MWNAYIHQILLKISLAKFVNNQDILLSFKNTKNSTAKLTQKSNDFKWFQIIICTVHVSTNFRNMTSRFCKLLVREFTKPRRRRRGQRRLKNESTLSHLLCLSLSKLSQN